MYYCDKYMHPHAKCAHAYTGVQALAAMEQSRLHRRRAKADARPPQPTVITQLPQHLDAETLANALLLVDKPKVAMGWAHPTYFHPRSIQPNRHDGCVPLTNDNVYDDVLLLKMTVFQPNQSTRCFLKNDSVPLRCIHPPDFPRQQC